MNGIERGDKLDTGQGSMEEPMKVTQSTKTSIVLYKIIFAHSGRDLSSRLHQHR